MVFLMCVLMVILMVQTVVALTEKKFHVMQKNVPRLCNYNSGSVNSD